MALWHTVVAWWKKRCVKPAEPPIEPKRKHKPVRDRILEDNCDQASLKRLNELFPVNKLEIMHVYSQEDKEIIKSHLVQPIVGLLFVRETEHLIFHDPIAGREVVVSFVVGHPANQLVQVEYITLISYKYVGDNKVEPLYYYISFANDWITFLVQNKMHVPGARAVAIQLEKFIRDSRLPEDQRVYTINRSYKGFGAWDGGLGHIPADIDPTLEARMLQ